MLAYSKQYRRNVRDKACNVAIAIFTSMCDRLEMYKEFREFVLKQHDDSSCTTAICSVCNTDGIYDYMEMMA